MVDEIPITGLPAQVSRPLVTDIFCDVNLGITKKTSALAMGIAGLTSTGILIGDSNGNISQDTNFSYNTAAGAITIGAKSLLLAGNLTTAGAFSSTFTMTGVTTVTFPTSGTLAITGSTIPSISGTASQVLVNGTSGSPISGTAITLTLPQNIATTSSPTFSSLTLLNAGNSSLTFNSSLSSSGQTQLLNFKINSSSKWTIGYNAATSNNDFSFLRSNDSSILSLFQTGNIAIGSSSDDAIHTLQVNGSIIVNAFNLIGGDLNDVLICSGSGDGVWVPLDLHAVTSLSGTANQINPSASTGDITLSLTNGISLGSFQSTASPTGGIITPGSVGIGSDLTTAGTFNSASDLLTLYSTASLANFTLINANSAAGGLAAINLLHDRGSASASGTTLGYIAFGGATDASHTFKLGGATIRSVTTEAWSGSANGCYISFHTTPNTTTTLTEAVRINQNASVNIGASFIGAAGIANGLLVQTHIGIAIASPATYAMLHAAADSTTAYIGNFTGTLTVTDTGATSGSMRGISMSPTFNPSSNPASGSLAASFYAAPVFNAAGGTLDKFYVYYANHSLSGNSSTITDLFGFLYDGGTSYSGTATNVYGGYFKIPAGGTNKHALHADNLSIGTYVGSNAPANGNVIISGNVSIGSSTVNSAFNVGSSNQFQVNSTGFLRIGGAPSGSIQFLMNQIFLATSGALAGLQIQSPMGASSGTVAEVDSVFLYTDLSVNVGTTTLATSLNIGGGVTGGTVSTGVGINVNALAFGTNRYGLKVTTPSGGTVAIATYTDNLVVGSSYVTSNPAANSAIIQGNVGIGTATFLTGSNLQIGTTTTASTSIAKLVTNSGTNNNPIFSFFGSGVAEQLIALDTSQSNGNMIFCVNPASYTTANLQTSAKMTLNGATGGINIGFTSTSVPPALGGIISGNLGVGTASPLNIGTYNLTVGDGSGTTAYLSINSANASQSGFKFANSSSVKWTFARVASSNDLLLFADGSGLNSMYFSQSTGAIGIGNTSVNAACLLEVTSTTQGIRFPNMTTTQKNAIANVAGNVVFDTTLGKLCVNSGSAWQTITSI